jgi:hypothetical protein
VLLSLPDLHVLVREAMRDASPALAAKLPTSLDSTGVLFAGLGVLVSAGVGSAPSLSEPSSPRPAPLSGHGGTRSQGIQSPAVLACNGFPQLCDRRIGEVVFPAAHNATFNPIGRKMASCPTKTSRG